MTIDLSRYADEPDTAVTDVRALLSGQLDHYRASLHRKLDALPAADLTRSLLPSGWTPAELLHHLIWVERRWVQWDFAGRTLLDPRGDEDPSGRWRAEAGVDQLRRDHLEAWRVSDELTAGHDLGEHASTVGRFPSDPPTLGWILLHLLQEYARHLGQLDVVVELAVGAVGE